MGRMFTVWAVLAPLLAAQAAEVPFTITTASGTFEILHYPLPDPHHLSLEERLCRVALSFEEGKLSSQLIRCSDEVKDEIDRALSQWSVRAPLGLTGRDMLGEVWFVYPAGEARAPRMLIRQSHDRALSLPAGIEVVPFMIQEWAFIQWPSDLHRDDHPGVQCHVAVESDELGSATAVSVTGCEDPFRANVFETLSRLRFEPAIIDGEPLPTALSLAATFLAQASPTSIGPSEESRQLWDQREFAKVNRSDRLWFIREALLGTNDRDLGPGHVIVSLPKAPVVERRAETVWASELIRQQPPLPEHPPVMLLGAPNTPGIEVYEMALPSTTLGPAVCPVVIQVDDTRRVVSWAEKECDTSLRSLAIRTVNGWILNLMKSEETSESYARFHARIEVGSDGLLQAVFPRDEFRSVSDGLPAGVHTERAALVTSRVPPRIPKGTKISGGLCEVVVDIDVKGRPRNVTLIESVSEAPCPEDMGRVAVSAVKRWRWTPAERDGVSVSSSSRAVVRFQE